MRRGLLKWDRDEVPESVLEARLARLRRGMRDAGLDAVLVYTSFPRPAAVSYLVHFVPYWSQGLLAVLPDGPPALLVSLSKRVGDWIRTTAHVGELIHTPDLGRAAAALVAERAGPRARVGVVELDRLPAGISRTLAANGAGSGMALADASDLFCQARAPADDTEVSLSTHAAKLAARAMAAGLAAPGDDCGALIAAVERTARLDGAEEVQVLFAPDLAESATLERIEGRRAFGERFAVRVSLAHKGHWVRIGRSYARDGRMPREWNEALRKFREALENDAPSGWRTSAGGTWDVEGCVGTLPLQPLIVGNRDLEPLPGGAVVTAGAAFETGGEPYLVSEPVVLSGDPSRPARRLAVAEDREP